MQGNAVLTNTLPDGFTYVSARQRWCGGSDWCERQPDQWTGAQATWTLWPLDVGEWNELYITVRITDTATGLDTFTHQAGIFAAAPFSDTDPYNTNNHAQLELPVDLPYFTVGKTYTSAAIAGAPITYTLTVANTGHGAGTGVILSDTIPAGLENVSGGTILLPWVWWYIDRLAENNGVVTKTLAARLPCRGTIVNDDYRVVASDQGVHSAAGAPVSVEVIAPTLAAGIALHPTGTVVNTPIVFTGTATTNGPAVAEWAWDFGDESAVAFGPDATHSYTRDGVFTVKLTITDTCGYPATTAMPVTITTPTLVANFTPSAVSAVVNATLHFTDTSTTNGAPVVAWMWDFGDESTRVFTQNASHAYTTAGVFTVTLTVTDTLGYWDTHTAALQIQTDRYTIFLPLVLRNH